MPSSPTPLASSPTGRAGKSKQSLKEVQSRAPHGGQVPPSPRRAQSYTPQSSPNTRGSARPAPARRHTTQSQPLRSSRPLPAIPAQGSRPSPSRKRTPTSSSSPPREGPHVLIPVPIRARDAQSPSFIRAPSGQHVDFVFSPPKKRGLLGRLLDSVEWGDPQKSRPYQYRKPTLQSSSSRPFYKKILS